MTLFVSDRSLGSHEHHAHSIASGEWITTGTGEGLPPHSTNPAALCSLGASGAETTALRQLSRVGHGLAHVAPSTRPGTHTAAAALPYLRSEYLRAKPKYQSRPWTSESGVRRPWTSESMGRTPVRSPLSRPGARQMLLGQPSDAMGTAESGVQRLVRLLEAAGWYEPSLDL